MTATTSTLWLAQGFVTVLDDVVAADNLVGVKAVAPVVEIDFRRFAQQGPIHLADDLAIFTELKILGEQHANHYEQIILAK